jgi:hypothetical protein
MQEDAVMDIRAGGLHISQREAEEFLLLKELGAALRETFEPPPSLPLAMATLLARLAIESRAPDSPFGPDAES